MTDRLTGDRLTGPPSLNYRGFMNIYQIDCAGWSARVKAASWSAAISRGLAVISRGKDGPAINSKTNDSVTVRARVMVRNIPQGMTIPPWDEDRKTE